MKLTSAGSVPVYTIAGASTARPLPEWLARKRKRSLKKDAEYANRVELLQDFEFEEASSCIRVSEDGDWLMSTGTYKPQIHVHNLPQLSLSFARHTNALNQKFVLLSTDYTKSLHLQSDRFLEFHSSGGVHYSTRIPRYGRDLVYVRKTTEALVPTVGVNENGNGEVFRLNLELGRFMKAYEVDVGGDDHFTIGAGSLQGGINAGAVNTAAVAESSHNIHAFGTSMGTVEFWDSRSRSRLAVLPRPQHYSLDESATPQITCLEFHSSGLKLATGTSTGLVSIYDLRSSVPLLQKEQGYDEPIQNLRFLDSSLSREKIMSSDKRILKIWDSETGEAWTSVEPAVDLNHVEWVPKTGMFLTANEGRQQHSFFIPQLGPAPKWCSFLDNLVEEMAEDADDVNSYKANGYGSSGTVYDNYKFLTIQQLHELSMDHLIGQTSLLRPYMHGYFVAQKLYEQARLISNPLLFEQERTKSIQDKIAKERESRIRGSKAVKVKVNRKLAEKMVAREDANERRKAKRLLRQGDDDEDGDNAASAINGEAAVTGPTNDSPAEASSKTLIDPRFASLFENTDFQVDETSHEYQSLNPSSLRPEDTSNHRTERRRGLTAVEQEALDDTRHSDSSASSNASDDEQDDQDAVSSAHRRQRAAERTAARASDTGRIANASYSKAGKRSHDRDRSGDAARAGARVQMRVSSSAAQQQQQQQRHAKPARSGDRSFGQLAAEMPGRKRNDARRAGGGSGAVVGERSVSYVPRGKDGAGQRRRPGGDDGEGRDQGRTERRGHKDRRSASGNVFRGL